MVETNEQMSAEVTQKEDEQKLQEEAVPTTESEKQAPKNDDFYIRYYVGHQGKFGHEFLEFEIQGKKGRLRYTNNSQYKTENLIRKEGKSNFHLTKLFLVHVNAIVIEEL